MAGYATQGDVEALNSQREYTAISAPTRDDVESFLTKTAAKLDGILAARGYLTPVPTSASQARQLVAHFNAVGAWAYVEQSAPASASKDAAWEAWMECLKELRDGEVELADAPLDTDETRPRYCFPATPMHFRDTRF